MATNTRGHFEDVSAETVPELGRAQGFLVETSRKCGIGHGGSSTPQQPIESGLQSGIDSGAQGGWVSNKETNEYEVRQNKMRRQRTVFHEGCQAVLDACSESSRDDVRVL